jgi:hypothetical protein
MEKRKKINNCKKGLPKVSGPFVVMVANCQMRNMFLFSQTKTQKKCFSLSFQSLLMQHLQSYYYCSTTAQKKKKEKEKCNAMLELKLLLNSFIYSYNSFKTSNKM